MSMINVCHVASGDLWAGAEVQIYTTLEGLSHVSNVEVSAITLNDGELAEKLKRCTARCLIIDEKKKHFLRMLIETIRFLKTRNVNIIHTHRYKENLLGGLSGLVCRIPVIRTQHGIGDMFSGIKALKMTIYMCIDYLVGKYLTNRVIAVSNEMAAHLRKIYGTNKIAVIHNGVREIDSADWRSSAT